MSTGRNKGRSAPRKRPPRARIRTLNEAHAEELREFSKRKAKRELFPEPEPKGRYVP